MRSFRRIHHTALVLDGADPDGAPAIKVDGFGFLRARAPVTRTGVFSYRLPDGRVQREYRPPDEVFAADSLASMHLIPVMLEHPDDGPVTPDTPQRPIGTAADPAAKPDAGQVLASFVITDSEGQAAIIEGTHREISCGYVCQHDMTSGVTPEGEPYDLIQRNIRYNHIAATKKGRAGASIAFPRLDSADRNAPANADVDATVGVCFDDTIEMATRRPQQTNDSEPLMSAPADKTPSPAPATRTVKIDSVEITTDPTAASALEALQAKCDSLTARAAKAENALAERAAADKAAADSAARQALVTKATEAAGGDFKADGLSNHEVRAAIVKLLEGDDIAARSAEYVEARFDSAVAHAAKQRAGHAEAAASHAQVRVDGFAAGIPATETPVQKAHREMREANANAWRNAKSA